MKGRSKVVFWLIVLVIIVVGGITAYLYSSGKLFSNADVNSSSGSQSILTIKYNKFTGSTTGSNSAVKDFQVFIHEYYMFAWSGSPDPMEHVVYDAQFTDNHGSDNGIKPDENDADGVIGYPKANITYISPTPIGDKNTRVRVTQITPYGSDCYLVGGPERLSTGGQVNYKLVCKASQDQSKGGAGFNIQSGSSSAATSSSAGSVAPSLAGAKIYYRQNSGAWTLYGNSDSDGVYGAFLAPGTYDFKVELNGYATATLTAKTVSVSTPVNETINLIANTVTPTASPSATTSASAIPSATPSSTATSSEGFKLGVRDKLTNAVVPRASLTVEYYDTQAARKVWTVSGTGITGANGATTIMNPAGMLAFGNNKTRYQWRVRTTATGFVTRLSTLNVTNCITNSICNFTIKLSK